MFATVPFVSMVKVLEHQPEAILQVFVWPWAMNESITLYFFNPVLYREASSILVVQRQFRTMVTFSSPGGWALFDSGKSKLSWPFFPLGLKTVHQEGITLLLLHF